MARFPSEALRHSSQPHCYRCGEGEARICVSCADELVHDEGRIIPPDWWPEWARESAHWRAALYVLDAPGIREHVGPYISRGQRRMPSFMELYQLRSWTEQERLLIGAAAALFNGDGWACSLGDLVRYLDDDALRRVLDAARLYRDPSLLAGGDD